MNTIGDAADSNARKEDARVPDSPLNQNTSGATQHWIFMDVCKVIAVLLIVVMHVSAGAWGQSQMGSFDWHVLNVFNCLSRIGLPLFFMQVGAVMLNERNGMPAKTLFSQHTLRIITAFFFWSGFYMVTYYLFDAPGGFGDFDASSFVTSFLAGAPYSQWFILLAISMYLLIPILSSIAQNRNACKYFLVLWALFAIVLPTLYRIPTLFPDVSPALMDGVTLAANTVNQVRPSMVLEFPGYMLLGYYLHNTEFSSKKTLAAVLLGLGGYLYMVLCTAGVTLRDGAYTETFFNSFSIHICLMTVGVMLGIKYLMKKVWFGPKTYQGLRFFSYVSFGIFLIHDFLRMGLVRLGLETLSFPPILSVPVLAILVFVVSGAIAYWLKALPKVGSFIVGG